MSLTSEEIELLYKATGEEVGARGTWQSHPEQASAIAALLTLPDDRLREVVVWAMSDAELPGYEEGAFYGQPFLRALIESGRLSHQEHLKLAVDIVIDRSWDMNSIHEVFNAKDDYPVLKNGFSLMHPYDAVTLFKNFLFAFRSDQDAHVNREVSILWGPIIAKMIDWGTLSEALRQITDTMLVSVENHTTFWNALIDTRLRTVDLKG